MTASQATPQGRRRCANATGGKFGMSRLVQVGNGIELEAVSLQFEPYR